MSYLEGVSLGDQIAGQGFQEYFKEKGYRAQLAEAKRKSEMDALDVRTAQAKESREASEHPLKMRQQTALAELYEKEAKRGYKERPLGENKPTTKTLGDMSTQINVLEKLAYRTQEQEGTLKSLRAKYNEIRGVKTPKVEPLAESKESDGMWHSFLNNISTASKAAGGAMGSLFSPPAPSSGPDAPTRRKQSLLDQYGEPDK